MAGSSRAPSQPIKIASISGYSGDRKDALASVLSGGMEVDAIVGDFLAEMNLSWRKAEMELAPATGHDPTFVKILDRARAQLEKRLNAGTFPKIVVNAGALNPRQLALDVHHYLNSTFGESGRNVKIAYVTGDDILHLVRNPNACRGITHMNTNVPLSEWHYKPVIANTYIGQSGFVAALRASADIVLAGRTTDASAVQALATWWHDWDAANHDNQALGLVAGHLVECGQYVTGGNFCGFKSIEPYYDVGYPIVEIHANNHCIITKQPDQNGLVDVNTVRSQLMYEIQGRYYLNPDVTADLKNVTVSQETAHRVSVSGIKGLPPPTRLKTAIQAYAGYRAEVLIFAIGPDLEEKARSFEKQMRRDMAATIKDPPKLTFQLLGRSAHDPTSTEAATAIIRIFAQAKEAETLSRENFQHVMIGNLGQAFPGFTPNLEYLRTSLPQPYLTYFPALIPRDLIQLKVHQMRSSGEFSTTTISDPFGKVVCADIAQEDYDCTTPIIDLSTFGPSIRIPLGHQVFARSGDKGSNVNVGFFSQGDSQAEWDWLRCFLSKGKMTELLGDDARDVSRMERVEFPNLKCVHFVLFDMLGGGVTETSRHDSLGKGLAEFLRARIVDYPELLYRGFRARI